jgi:hypothetical protein
MVMPKNSAEKRRDSPAHPGRTDGRNVRIDRPRLALQQDQYWPRITGLPQSPIAFLLPIAHGSEACVRAAEVCNSSAATSTTDPGHAFEDFASAARRKQPQQYALKNTFISGGIPHSLGLIGTLCNFLKH